MSEKPLNWVHLLRLYRNAVYRDMDDFASKAMHILFWEGGEAFSKYYKERALADILEDNPPIRIKLALLGVE